MHTGGILNLCPRLPLDKSNYIFIVPFAYSCAKNLKFHLSYFGGKVKYLLKIANLRIRLLKVYIFK